MQWLFIVRPTRPDMLTGGPTPAEIDSVTRHFGYWKDLTEQGRALVVGRTQTTGPETIGIAIFYTDTEEDAMQVAQNDPAVVDGVFAMELLPYQVALLGDTARFQQ